MIDLEEVKKAQHNLSDILSVTSLDYSENYSKRYDCNIFFKREDTQPVRSYKIRGAYNRMSNLNKAERAQNIVCASAGNHAQGVAYCCAYLQIIGHIFMPVSTPKQKIKQVKRFGKEFITIHLVGNTFDDAEQQALAFCKQQNAVYISPFDHKHIIAGQGTTALEIIFQMDKSIDYICVPLGGGGLASGIISVFKRLSPQTKIIAFEPKGAPSFTESKKAGKNIKLAEIDKFVDGAAVQQMGALTFSICQDNLDEVHLIEEGQICNDIVRLYEEEAIVAEPAGALAISGLDKIKDQIKGKNVVCILSGGNNDITRMEEIKEKSFIYEGLRHYYILKMTQQPGALRDLINNCLGPNDDIVFFQYTKKNSREKGYIMVGIDLVSKDDFPALHKKLTQQNFVYEYLNENHGLLEYLL